MTTESSMANNPNAVISRRGVVVGAGGFTLAASLGRAHAAGAEKTLKIGFISPRSGALAGFGEGDGYVLGLVRKALAGGLKVGNDTYKVEILDRDTQSDPSRASQLAKSLINNDKIDLMLSTSTPEVVNPVADACEAAGVPSLSTVTPWESFYFGRGGKPSGPSPFKWSFLFSFGTKEFAESYLATWGGAKTNKKVAVLYPNDADGNAVRRSLGPLLEKGGYKVVDPGPYEDGTTDYSAQIALFKKEGCEIFNTFPIPPDFAAFWRQAAQQGFTRMVKIPQIGKTCLFPSQVEALGDLGDNLLSAAYWHKVWPYKSSATGVSGVELADGYEKATGKQWQQQLGASMSLLDAGLAVIKTSSDPTDKEAVRKSLAALNADTMVGKVSFKHGPFPNICVTTLVNCQWVKAPAGSKYKFDYVTINNANDSNVPVQAKLKYFNM